MITIDELRRLNGRITYQPLGAVRITFRKNLIYQFYSKLTPPVNPDNYHTHPYSFNSTIIKGGIRNHIYHFEESNEETKCRLQARACRRGVPLTTVYENVNFNEVLTYDTYEGNSYDMHYTVMHKIEPLGPKVISLLRKGPAEDDVLFIFDKTVHFTEEELFDLKTKDECWEIVEYTLNDND